MNDKRMADARRAVREAADRLVEQGAALAAASAEAAEIGLVARVEDLRRAVIAASLAGVSREDLARDADVDVAVVDDLVSESAAQSS
ncbi:hypothetical protein [Streptantibioticus cattleyicolor]|uniref:Uncharacterized protein n=1 Tax=Streptantibioticus cattleyicolor (strain ATCC 35852 / DSM 46488 / JCM 4925 / NBRC 14057 / NRRL 8057) TaxID=1003195 RepID=F8JJI4_STREN|nr:hypothetical protein [Streptantibioticus cattleyicolor]AEW98688.1 hypothetical protein SCATT_p04950 [Streptantibioticus cattleyicolor NRRL 8057 = DSM 46488]CCB72255.1 protein of unknown function [Streptantibioticus cattleyicolor NRRL 8057 = DSM 46488]